jgi:hypothetical protein
MGLTRRVRRCGRWASIAIAVAALFAIITACGTVSSPSTASSSPAARVAVRQQVPASVAPTASSNGVVVPSNPACQVISLTEMRGVLGFPVQFVRPLPSDPSNCYFYSHSLGGGKWLYAATVADQCGSAAAAVFAVDEQSTTQLEPGLYLQEGGASAFAYPIRGCIISTAIGTDGLTGQSVGSALAMKTALRGVINAAA